MVTVADPAQSFRTAVPAGAGVSRPHCAGALVQTASDALEG